jgi:LacI family transcriptional regulator
MSARLQDVARLADVSVATVSRVINGIDRVAPATVDRVRQAIHQLDYQPHAVARSLRTGTTAILGMLVPDIGNPFFTAIVRAVEDEAQAQRYSVILCNTDESQEKESRYLEVMQSQRVAGLIVAATGNGKTLCRAIDDGLVVVAVDRALTSRRVDSVLVDNVQSARLAVDHLLQLGHERIAVIGGPQQAATARERVRGAQLALQGARIKLTDDLLLHGDFHETSGYELTARLLRGQRPPTAIFATNNLMGVGALEAIREAGLDVPRDISFVSFDAMPWEQFLPVPVTRVVQPATEIGRLAARMAIERIQGFTGRVRELRLGSQLLMGHSCAPPRRSSGRSIAV